MSQRVLIIAAHPDDEVLGCGGTIAKHVEADHPVRVVYLAEGVTGRFDPEQFESPEVRELSDRRHRDAVRALGLLGVPEQALYFGVRHSCRLDQVPLIDCVKQIEGHLREFEPTKLYTHWPYDTNVDHRIAWQAVLAATRPTSPSALSAIYAFEVLSSTEWNPMSPFHANVFHDITPYIDLKVQALKTYIDEVQPAPHPRSEEALRALATYRGGQAGAHYAEAFNLVRMIES